MDKSDRDKTRRSPFGIEARSGWDAPPEVLEQSRKLAADVSKPPGRATEAEPKKLAEQLREHLGSALLPSPARQEPPNEHAAESVGKTMSPAAGWIRELANSQNDETQLDDAVTPFPGKPRTVESGALSNAFLGTDDAVLLQMDSASKWQPHPADNSDAPQTAAIDQAGANLATTSDLPSAQGIEWNQEPDDNHPDDPALESGDLRENVCGDAGSSTAEFDSGEQRTARTSDLAIGISENDPDLDATSLDSQRIDPGPSAVFAEEMFDGFGMHHGGDDGAPVESFVVAPLDRPILHSTANEPSNVPGGIDAIGGSAGELSVEVGGEDVAVDGHSKYAVAERIEEALHELSREFHRAEEQRERAALDTAIRKAWAG